MCLLFQGPWISVLASESSLANHSVLVYLISKEIMVQCIPASCYDYEVSLVLLKDLVFSGLVQIRCTRLKQMDFLTN